MVEAACRKGMVTVATVLRGSLERAVRSVSHCQVRYEWGNLRGQQLQTAVSLKHRGKSWQAYSDLTFNICSLLWGEFMRKWQIASVGLVSILCVWITDYNLSGFTVRSGRPGSSSLTENEHGISKCCKSAVCARGCSRWSIEYVPQLCASASVCVCFHLLPWEQWAAHVSTQLCDVRMCLSENGSAVI